MKVDGPIQMRESLPFGSARLEGSEQDQLLKKFDYVEDEFFIRGVAPIYGPESSRALQPGEDPWNLKPLSSVKQPDAPYKTRIQVIRPQGAPGFSGIVHVIPFHVLSTQASVERHLLRHGDVWVGVELCEGTRFGRDEVPTGGLANLRRADPTRYGDLSMVGGDPRDWGDLRPGAVGRAFERLNWGEAGAEVQVFVQELFRSYAQAPGIFFDLVRAIRSGEGGILPGWPVRRIYTSGASATAQILRPFIDYHHNANLLPGDVAPVDGYFIRVGVVPANRPMARSSSCSIPRRRRCTR
jgi:Alpha/beta hydrolase domain